MIAVSDVAARVAYLLIDPDHIRWSLTEIIAWMNESAGAIMTRRPAALARRSVIALEAGTLQTIEGSMLLDVTRNFAANGTTPGGVIRRSDRQLLDDSDPNWHTSKPKTAVKQYTYDDRTPQIFYVYPPVVDGVKVEVLEAALPATIDSEGDSLDIGAEYLEAVTNYVCYRCNSKDSEFSSPSAAVAFYQAFESALGIKSQTQAAASPNQPGNSV